jgi:hypothetical protein
LFHVRNAKGARQGGGGMSRYRAQDVPVSYTDRLYSNGEVLEASEEEMQSFLQACYVKPAEEKRRSFKRK